MGAPHWSGIIQFSLCVHSLDLLLRPEGHICVTFHLQTRKDARFQIARKILDTALISFRTLMNGSPLVTISKTNQSQDYVIDLGDCGKGKYVTRQDQSFWPDGSEGIMWALTNPYYTRVTSLR